MPGEFQPDNRFVGTSPQGGIPEVFPTLPDLDDVGEPAIYPGYFRLDRDPVDGATILIIGQKTIDALDRATEITRGVKEVVHETFDDMTLESAAHAVADWGRNKFRQVRQGFRDARERFPGLPRSYKAVMALEAARLLSLSLASAEQAGILNEAAKTMGKSRRRGEHNIALDLSSEEMEHFFGPRMAYADNGGDSTRIKLSIPIALGNEELVYVEIPTPTATRTPTPSPSPSPTYKPTEVKPTVTLTALPSPSSTPSPTESPTPSPSPTLELGPRTEPFSFQGVALFGEPDDVTRITFPTDPITNETHIYLGYAGDFRGFLNKTTGKVDFCLIRECPVEIQSGYEDQPLAPEYIPDIVRKTPVYHANIQNGETLANIPGAAIHPDAAENMEYPPLEVEYTVKNVNAAIFGIRAYFGTPNTGFHYWSEFRIENGSPMLVTGYGEGETYREFEHIPLEVPEEDIEGYKIRIKFDQNKLTVSIIDQHGDPYPQHDAAANEDKDSLDVSFQQRKPILGQEWIQVWHKLNLKNGVADFAVQGKTRPNFKAPTPNEVEGLRIIADYIRKGIKPIPGTYLSWTQMVQSLLDTYENGPFLLEAQGGVVVSKYAPLSERDRYEQPARRQYLQERGIAVRGLMMLGQTEEFPANMSEDDMKEVIREEVRKEARQGIVALQPVFTGGIDHLYSDIWGKDAKAMLKDLITTARTENPNCIIRLDGRTFMRPDGRKPHGIDSAYIELIKALSAEGTPVDVMGIQFNQSIAFGMGGGMTEREIEMHLRGLQASLPQGTRLDFSDLLPEEGMHEPANAEFYEIIVRLAQALDMNSFQPGMTLSGRADLFNFPIEFGPTGVRLEQGRDLDLYAEGPNIEAFYGALEGNGKVLQNPSRNPNKRIDRSRPWMAKNGRLNREMAQ